MDEYNGKVKVSCIKRLRKRKSLEFVGWCSKNLIEFLDSIGEDITNKISERDVIFIIMKYIRELNCVSLLDKSKTKKKRKTVVVCDEKLRLLFECQKINTVKVPDLVEKHYPENQEDDDSDFGFFDDDKGKDDDEGKDDKFKPAKEVVKKRKGEFAAIVSDNIKLLYLRKSLVEGLAESPESFESKVMGCFVRIKNPYDQVFQVKNPYQLVHVIGVKEGNPIDGHDLLVTNYSDYMKNVPSSCLSDEDFTQEECEELHQGIKNGCAKRLTVVDMEEKVRSLHEDVTKHWLARELVLLQGRINRTSEKGWGREKAEYLERRDLLTNPEEQSRLLREIPEVVAEELEAECVDDDMEIENDFVETTSTVSFETHRSDKEHQPCDSPVSTIQSTRTASADEQQQNKVSNTEVEMTDLHKEPQAQATPPEIIQEDVLEPPANGITQKKAFIPKVEPIDLENEPQAQPNPTEIIELSDDDDDDDDSKNKNNEGHQHYDPKQVIWLYEYPEGNTNGPFCLADLKSWNDEGFFTEIPEFKVWMRGDTSECGVVLTKLLPLIKT